MTDKLPEEQKQYKSIDWDLLYGLPPSEAEEESTDAKPQGVDWQQLTIVEPAQKTDEFADEKRIIVDWKQLYRATE